jgi:hypothetical protein
VSAPANEIRRAARRRWLLVAGLVAALCAAPPVIAAIPVPESGLAAPALRAHVLASAAVPHEGLAESNGALGLPDLPRWRELGDLLSGTTRMRVWYDSPQRWRLAVITPTGEQDLYRTPTTTYAWDYERNLLAQVDGDPPVRLPRATDLTPPDLARRLLGAMTRGDRLTRLPTRRVAGMTAVGLRVVPADPATTIGRVDLWAEAGRGLPVEVRVYPRGSTLPVLSTRFLDLRLRRPAGSALLPNPAPDVRPARFGLRALGLLRPDRFGEVASLPDRLAGRAARPAPGGIEWARVYGTGYAALAVLPLPRWIGDDTLEAAYDAGGQELAPQVVAIRTALLTLVVAGDARDGRTYLLAGMVDQKHLHTAATELLGSSEGPN